MTPEELVWGAAALGYGLFSAYLMEDIRARQAEIRNITTNVRTFRSMGLFDAANALSELLYHRESARYAMRDIGINLARDIEHGSELLYRRLGDFDSADYCRQYVEYADSGRTHWPTVQGQEKES